MLRFQLFGMPVVVRGSFLLIAAFVGFIGVGDLARSVAWLVIVFFSILIHELGHAFTARMYGSTVAIELNGLGGLTRWGAPDGELTPGRRALIAAAGSATGLVFGGLVWVVARQFDPYPPLTAFILENVIYVNVFWGLLNWLPIRALDGGHLLESFLEKVIPEKAESVGRVVFIATAAAGVLIAIRLDLLFIAILAGWMLLSEFATGQRAPAAGLPMLDYEAPASDEPSDPAAPGEQGEETPEDAWGDSK
ncbi:MAG TPA: site-2 protease family protein [Acidimicrobiia bacterium]|nr:site-2 protease family protein [Acidimicrobiia bacterium]